MLLKRQVYFTRIYVAEASSVFYKDFEKYFFRCFYLTETKLKLSGTIVLEETGPTQKVKCSEHYWLGVLHCTYE